MNQQELFRELRAIVDDVQTAVLITCGHDNYPRGRWMTPAILTDYSDRIYCFSMPDSVKIAHINNNGNVAWLFQTHSLRKVISITGLARVIDNPSLKAELMETLAARLATFWKVNIDQTTFVVIETLITKAEYFKYK
jgi:pyridoxamine 5'-phosphate oxidase